MSSAITNSSSWGWGGEGVLAIRLSLATYESAISVRREEGAMVRQIKREEKDGLPNALHQNVILTTSIIYLNEPEGCIGFLA